MKIAIIGYGNMGKAMYERLKDTFELAVMQKGDSSKCIENADAVIIAVKPQSYEELAKQLQGCLASKKVISIMTGITLEYLLATTGSTNVVRAMPNLPLKVGKALTGWIASSEGEWVLPILKAFGEEIRVHDEAQLECITATSGSGPAYFFYLCELLQKQAQEYGFGEDESRRIAEATFIGAAALLKSSDQSAEHWRTHVTSKGGTTNAAITYLQDNHFDAIFWQAIDKARQRAVELKEMTSP